MNRKTKILIFPSEAENAFEIYNSLRYSTRFEVWGGSSKQGYTSILFENYTDQLPFITEENFLSSLNAFTESKNIEYILPTHDDVSLFLIKNKKKIHASIIGSDERCAYICREKKITYEVFKEEPFCPDIFTNIEKIIEWPVFIKPNKGQGSVDASIAKNKEDLQFLIKKIKEPIICEYLPGKEYTVDCFTDKNKKLIFIGPRTREVVKMGIAFRSTTINLTPEVENIAITINNIIKPRGIWFFQLKYDKNGNPKLLEVSCRAAGSMSLYRQKGINLPLLAAYDAIGMNVKLLNNTFSVTMQRKLQSSYICDIRFFEYVYIDYDDTLIINNKVNSQLMQAVYELKNKDKKIILITKHKGNIYENMEKFHIPISIFTEIIHLENTQEKSKFITEEKSIFIDNLFSEREKVLKNNFIPVFDVDAIDAIL